MSVKKLNMEQHIGEIRIISQSTPPPGWRVCNGQSLSIQQNLLLFVTLGAIYGGDGNNTFALPDLPANTIHPKLGSNFFIALTGEFHTTH